VTLETLTSSSFQQQQKQAKNRARGYCLQLLLTGSVEWQMLNGIERNIKET